MTFNYILSCILYGTKVGIPTYNVERKKLEIKKEQINKLFQIKTVKQRN